MLSSAARKKSYTPAIKLKDPGLFHQQAYVNGQWVGDKAKKIEVANPATDEVLGTVPNLGAAETRAAIKAARVAWDVWRAVPAEERCNILRKWAALQTEHLDDLCRILTSEQGKPYAQARSEIMSGIGYVEWMAEEGRRVYGDVIPPENGGQRLVTYKQPVGVCAMITPWNFPSSMITRKAGPALAAGCTVVVKPSELTPFSALALAELAARAGMPKGVFNIVTGDAQPIGREMTDNVHVRKLSFTGSTAVGKLLMAQCAPTVKKVSLELGGNAPFIVFDDADLDLAVPAAVASKFRNAGQTCVCANRILVQEGIYDKFAAKFAVAVKAMKVGNGLEARVDIGPMININGVEKVERHLQDAVKHGAKVLTGGKRHAKGGTFFEPTVLKGATQNMVCFEEETFGPLAPLFKFKTEAEAVKLANDTSYGLAAYFFTRDAARIWRVSEALEYGMVGVNSVSIVSAQAPFGGWKQSGMGKEGSKYGIEGYLEIKLVAHGGL
ncbi:MAG: NAD-dependent succinate-semialdehyde dehydrogenase [Alphaproteobacteria bacterium]|nr:NAD-dependent succinate-semialdehyde dehydrogenase [Alphaproteobacteria bacterium]